MPWEQTSAQLQYIEDRCKAMKREAGKIQSMLEFMRGRPAFETLCEDQMKQLEGEIAVLYAFIKASRECFLKLPEVA